MKTIILAGGYGTRLSEETGIRPKPMVEIGGKPILWHIMKTYSHYGINDFIVCLGYKGHMITDYFSQYFLQNADVTFDLRKNSVEILQNRSEPWRVTLVDTGEETMTGGRLKRVSKYVEDETFCFTYGDGVTDLNIQSLIRFHKSQKTLATLTAVQPPGRFGAFTLPEENSKVSHFQEKPKGDGAWINGGYFVLEPEIFDYIEGDKTIWEQDCLKKLAKDGQLSAYKHTGYWQNMDTLRDKTILDALWNEKRALWKVWK